MRRFISAIAILGLLASGCTAGIATSAPTSSPRQESPPTTASKTLPSASADDAWLLVGKKGSDKLEVIRASTREQMIELPMGVPIGADWGRMVAAASAGEKTTVRELTVQPGLGGPETTVDGGWQLPTIGYDPTPVGLSADGSTVVLVEARPAALTTTKAPTSARFAVLRLGELDRPPRIIQLPGDFDYDAVAPDGSTLYVVEHLRDGPAGHYQVRAVDVASGSLKDGVVADKRGLVEPMAGWPLTQVRRADGSVFTLYRADEHPFIHALDTLTGTAVCIDLPATGARDADAARDWGLAPTPDGTSIYATNATLGLVIEIDPAQLAVRRSAGVKPMAAGGIVLAKFGHQEGGPVGRRSVVAPDGRTLYAAGGGGILAIGTSDLSVIGHFLDGQAIDALGVTTDGGTLYVLLHSGGRIVKLDASNGDVLGTVPGADYDRLLAVMPW